MLEQTLAHLVVAIGKNVDRNGFAVQHIAMQPAAGDTVDGDADPGRPNQPAWAYTIGLVETCGHPELVLFGLDADSAYDVLNVAGTQILDGRRFRLGRSSQERLRQLPVRVLAVPGSCWNTTLFQAWIEYYGRREPLQVPVPAALQLVWSDHAGRFPWHGETATRYRRLQPILEDVAAGRVGPTSATVEPSG